MNVSAHRDRVRRSSPLGGVTARQQAGQSVKQLVIDAVRIPAAEASVAPGEPVRCEFDVSNNALFIDAFDADRCDRDGNVCHDESGDPNIPDQGYCYEVVLEAGWGEDAAVVECTQAGDSEMVSHTFTAPQAAGDYTLAYRLRMNGTGRTSETGSVQIRVRDTDGNGGNGGNGNGDGGTLLPCFLDPNRACAFPEVAAWVGLLILVVVFVID